MTKISIKKGDGAEPAKLAQAIVEGQKFPFVAKLTHKSFKPLVVPSTGVCDVIKPGEPVEFKVKSFEQAWVLVTDCAQLATRYESDEKDFVVIEVPAVPKEKAVKASTDDATA